MAVAMSLRRKIITQAVFYTIYVLVAFLFVFPLVYLGVASLKNDTQIVADMSSIKAFIPYGELSFNNYISIMNKMDFFRFFRNSTVVTVINVVFGTVINAMIGYALGLLRFKGRGFLISLCIALAIIPTEAVIISRFLVTNQLKMLNSYAGLAVPTIATPMYIFLFYSHFKGMPRELLEAAVVDGDNYASIFWRIMLPLSKPICATVAIMAFIRTWGDLLWPTLVTRDERFRTLPQALRALSTDVYIFWGEIFAFGTLMVIPVLIVFLLFQKQFIQSLAMSGIKG
ncbi:carbohydrate ABC transporter permease [Breznakiella homolactica]|uniref:Carbohydrate ABC transporter permease n=1 Tax=Breznakiella homolactica TaxID=2798577 RepID=A0A7T8B9T2_9SPIR|nr:carbohydrate ABC transporter permease [Breznakiella homolactica]QQO07518.1 carbohydrate ABC transporter permease [Breznakiella homolactica]